MEHAFDKDYWDEHWQSSEGADAAHPYLSRETARLTPGTALDAGCGEGREALWLADAGWQVTAVDIAAAPLARAAERDPHKRVQWVEADLGTWQPVAPFDLVSTHYAHSATSQLAFYERIASWVAPGGTLLIVGHLHGHHPDQASVTAEEITARLREGWEIKTAREVRRTVTSPGGQEATLDDVVVRAARYS